MIIICLNVYIKKNVYILLPAFKALFELSQMEFSQKQ